MWPAIPLNLFPQDSVAVTVTTSIWVGVCVVAFFNMRLGWTLSGLVVPGYLVPLIIVKPTAALVIIMESIVTYVSVFLISEKLFPRLGWCNFFGRDRFLALIVFSVAVRVFFDGFALPYAGLYLNQKLGLAIDYHNDLHSYGLVMVALMANYFWKPGLRRGMAPLTITVACTYAIVQYGFVYLTNFNAGNLQAMYDDIATSLLASPKAYMIVVTGAFIASTMNANYGWQYNGVLIPALLALQWHDPWKIFFTFCEAAIILMISSAALRLPVWKRTTVEGARKLIIFFTVCFLYRLALTHCLPIFFPKYLVTDFFGFGYLLSTLMAIRSYQHERKIQLIRTTLQASMMGAVGGTAIGFFFTLAPGRTPELKFDASSEITSHTTNRSMKQLLQDHKFELYRMAQIQTYQHPTSHQLGRFRLGLQLLKQHFQANDKSVLSKAQQALASAGFACSIVEKDYFAIHELPPGRGWGIYLLKRSDPTKLVVEVASPLSERGTMEAALNLFIKTKGAALAIASASKQNASSVLLRRGTIFHIFQQEMGKGGVLHVRGYDAPILRQLVGLRADEAERACETRTSSLWLRSGIPQGLDLRMLKSALGRINIHWGPSPLRNILRDSGSTRFAELFLNRRDLRRFRSSVVAMKDIDPSESDIFISNSTPYPWLLNGKQFVALRGENSYVPATMEEMIFMDQEVLSPLLRVMRQSATWNDATAEIRSEFRAIDMSARVLGYRLHVFDEPTGADFVILEESLPRKRHWGTIALRWDLNRPYIVEATRPLLERNTYEYAVHLFRNPNSACLMIAGANPRTNDTGDADLSRLRNKINFLNLARHVILRESGPKEHLVIQTRAIRAPVNADILMSVGQGLTGRDELTQLQKQFLFQLEHDGLIVKLLDGSTLSAGYEIQSALYESITGPHPNKEMASLWLSPALRSQLSPQFDNEATSKLYEAVQIPTYECSLADYLAGYSFGSHPQLHARSYQNIIDFLRSNDIVRLRRLQLSMMPMSMTRIVDSNSGQPFLVVASEDKKVAFVVNLSRCDATLASTFETEELTFNAVNTFLERRATILQPGRQP